MRGAGSDAQPSRIWSRRPRTQFGHDASTRRCLGRREGARSCNEGPGCLWPVGLTQGRRGNGGSRCSDCYGGSWASGRYPTRRGSASHLQQSRGISGYDRIRGPRLCVEFGRACQVLHVDSAERHQLCYATRNPHPWCWPRIRSSDGNYTGRGYCSVTELGRCVAQKRH